MTEASSTREVDKASVIRRWDGRTKEAPPWDHLDPDPEIYSDSSNCLVYLSQDQIDNERPSFKLSLELLVTYKCIPLIKKITTTPWTTDKHASGGLNLKRKTWPSKTQFYALYLDAPADYSNSKTLQYHITTRNFFAWLTGVPIVGLDLASAFVALKVRMHSWREPSSDNVTALQEYAVSQGYDDLGDLHSLLLRHFRDSSTDQAGYTLTTKPYQHIDRDGQHGKSAPNSTSLRERIRNLTWKKFRPRAASLTSLAVKPQSFTVISMDKIDSADMTYSMTGALSTDRLSLSKSSIHPGRASLDDTNRRPWQRRSSFSSDITGQKSGVDLDTTLSTPSLQHKSIEVVSQQLERQSMLTQDIVSEDNLVRASIAQNRSQLGSPSTLDKRHSGTSRPPSPIEEEEAGDSNKNMSKTLFSRNPGRASWSTMPLIRNVSSMSGSCFRPLPGISSHGEPFKTFKARPEGKRPNEGHATAERTVTKQEKGKGRADFGEILSTVGSDPLKDTKPREMASLNAEDELRLTGALSPDLISLSQAQSLSAAYNDRIDHMDHVDQQTVAGDIRARKLAEEERIVPLPMTPESEASGSGLDRYSLVASFPNIWRQQSEDKSQSKGGTFSDCHEIMCASTSGNMIMDTDHIKTDTVPVLPKASTILVNTTEDELGLSRFPSLQKDKHKAAKAKKKMEAFKGSSNIVKRDKPRRSAVLLREKATAEIIPKYKKVPEPVLSASSTNYVLPPFSTRKTNEAIMNLDTTINAIFLGSSQNRSPVELESPAPDLTTNESTSSNTSSNSEVSGNTSSTSATDISNPELRTKTVVPSETCEATNKPFLHTTPREEAMYNVPVHEQDTTSTHSATHSDTKQVCKTCSKVPPPILRRSSRRSRIVQTPIPPSLPHTESMTTAPPSDRVHEARLIDQILHDMSTLSTESLVTVTPQGTIEINTNFEAPQEINTNFEVPQEKAEARYLRHPQTLYTTSMRDNSAISESPSAPVAESVADFPRRKEIEDKFEEPGLLASTPSHGASYMLKPLSPSNTSVSSRPATAILHAPPSRPISRVSHISPKPKLKPRSPSTLSRAIGSLARRHVNETTFTKVIAGNSCTSNNDNNKKLRKGRLKSQSYPVPSRSSSLASNILHLDAHGNFTRMTSTDYDSLPLTGNSNSDNNIKINSNQDKVATGRNSAMRTGSYSQSAKHSTNFAMNRFGKRPAASTVEPDA